MLLSAGLSQRASPLGWSGSMVGKGRRACNYIFGNLNSPYNSLVASRRLSGEIFAKISAQNGNQRERKQTLKNMWKHTPKVMTSLLMSSLPISISHRLFWWGYSNSRDIVASSSSLSRPVARAWRRACLQATQLHDLQLSCSWASPLCVLVL